MWLDVKLLARKAICGGIREFIWRANLDFICGVEMQPHPNIHIYARKPAAVHFGVAVCIERRRVDTLVALTDNRST